MGIQNDCLAERYGGVVPEGYWARRPPNPEIQWVCEPFRIGKAAVYQMMYTGDKSLCGGHAHLQMLALLYLDFTVRPHRSSWLRLEVKANVSGKTYKIWNLPGRLAKVGQINCREPRLV